VRTFRLPGPWSAAPVITLVLWSAAARPARADLQLINNGGFEAGFASWNRQEFPGSDGTFSLQTGTSSPVNGDPVPAPPGGTTAAMTDAQGPGSHVLFQDFVVPVGTTSGTLRFSLFVGNRATDPTNPGPPLFATPSPATLDWTTPTLNQQARVDILRAGTDPFSVATADVLQNAFQTHPGDTFGPGYTTFTVDVSSLLAAQAGQTLRLRFAEADNIFTFQLGVDNVSLSAVPEPSSLVLYGVGALLVLARYGRRPLRPRA
jgi:hypothetical protein